MSDAKDSTSGLVNRGGIVDLPLLRTLLAICQKSQESSFWEVIDSCFVSICKFGHLKNPFATITSLSELYIQIYSDFYELWQQYKQQKTIEMSEAWPDTYNEGYQFQLKPNHKIH